MNLDTINVLLIAGDPGETQEIENLLHRANLAGYAPSNIDVTSKKNLQNAQSFLQRSTCDLILLVLSFADATSLKKMQKMKNSHPDIPMVVVGDRLAEEVAIQAVKQGAQEYLARADLSPNRLANTILLAIERHRRFRQITGRVIELESQNLALNDFAHTVAHQIQGLLSQMVGYASLVDSHYQEQLSAPAKQAVDQILQSGYKMNNVITELFFLASMRSEDVQVSILDNDRILREVMKRLRYQIRETKAKIILPESWPKALGYAPWIEEVWLNYMSNGLKYGGRPGSPPVLRLGAESESNGMVRFWLSDNGPGLSKIDKKRLFVPHTRVTSRKVRGEGVGLSIVWRIVKKCGGNVGVESEVGAGSCFWFTLPAYPANTP